MWALSPVYGAVEYSDPGQLAYYNTPISGGTQQTVTEGVESGGGAYNTAFPTSPGPLYVQPAPSSIGDCCAQPAALPAVIPQNAYIAQGETMTTTEQAPCGCADKMPVWVWVLVGIGILVLLKSN